MKKILITILTVISAWGSAIALENRFGSGKYEFNPSGENTKADEFAISPYKGKSFVFFRQDSAFVFVPGSDLDLDKVMPCPELQGLGILGTFAYDAKNKKLYFSKSNGQGDVELYEATENEEGKFKDVKKLKIKGTMAQSREVYGSSLAIGRWNHYVPGVKGFYNPCLGKNGRRIYFSGEFMAGKGGRDLWYIDKTEEEGVWSKPESVSDYINTEAREDYPFVLGDTAIYFASSKPGGQGGMDLYVSHKGGKEKDWDKPKSMGERFNSPADDYNAVGNLVTMYLVSNRAGGQGGLDIYFPNQYKISKTPELTPDFTIDEPKGFHWVLFFFDFNKTEMKPEYEAQLDELLRAMNEFPGERFEISGHTDSRGSADYNRKLSQKRAEYVRSLLIQKGFPANLIKAVGKGMDEPVIPNAVKEEEHEQNRRVDIKIIDD